jgi:hypothetical protein
MHRSLPLLVADWPIVGTRFWDSRSHLAAREDSGSAFELSFEGMHPGAGKLASFARFHWKQEALVHATSEKNGFVRAFSALGAGDPWLQLAEIGFVRAPSRKAGGSDASKRGENLASFALSWESGGFATSKHDGGLASFARFRLVARGSGACKQEGNWLRSRGFHPGDRTSMVANRPKLASIWESGSGSAGSAQALGGNHAGIDVFAMAHCVIPAVSVLTDVISRVPLITGWRGFANSLNPMRGNWTSSCPKSSGSQRIDSFNSSEVFFRRLDELARNAPRG